METLENQVVKILGRLVSINSVNPTLAGGPGEQEIAAYTARFLEKLGLQAQVQQAAQGRPNVFCILPGLDSARSILLNGHLDTVGTEGNSKLLSLERKGDRLFGRGAYDMKGGIAVMLQLAAYFSTHTPPVDILLTFVADEEDKSLGMEHTLSNWLPTRGTVPEAAIVLEPTEQQIGVRHKGFDWYEIEVSGKAAHGSRPEQGVDAILPLRLALEELHSISQELKREAADSLLGHATLHVGTVEGGTALSVIPSRSILCWERRTLPGEDPVRLDRELQRVVRAVASADGGHSVKGRRLFRRPPYKIADDAPILKQLQATSPQASLAGLSFWADSALCGLAGIPTLLYGPVGHGAHAENEWVSLKSMIHVYETLKQLILSL